MRHVIKGAVIGLGLLALSAGTSLAQTNNANDNGPGSNIVQNDGSSPNSGQQGGNLQVQGGSTVNDVGDGSNSVESEEDVSINATSAQAVDSTAVGGSYTEVDESGNLADGDIVEVDGDLAVATSGHAVEDGATTVSGGVAFGANFTVDDSFAVVGGDGAALLSETDELVDEGSAIVVGNSNATATAHDDAAAVGDTGTALYIDDGDDGSVFGSDNVVSINELEQEVAVDGGGPIFSVGAWTTDEVGELEPTDSSNPTITTGDIGGGGNPISINGMAGLNAFHVSTGAMNQGSIHAVAVTADSLTLN